MAVNSKSRRSGHWSWLVVVGVVLVAVGVGVGLLVAPVGAPGGLGMGGDPSSVPVSVPQFDDQRSVTLTLEASSGVGLVGRRSGVVTGVPDGLTVKSGGVVVWVDGLPLIGLATSVPLYRSLNVNDSGADVGALNAELTRLGYGAPVSNTFTRASRDAWVGLQKADGVPKPSKTFDLSAVVWLPSGSVQVKGWLFGLGSQTPGDGVLGVVPGVVLSGVVAMGDGSPLPSDSRTLTVNGVTVPLPADGVITDPGLLGAAGGVAMQVTQNDGDTQLQAQGSIELADVLTVLSVPPVAVFGLSGDAGCVQVDDKAIPVKVVGSSLGVSLIQTGDGSSPDHVMVGAGITATGC